MRIWTTLSSAAVKRPCRSGHLRRSKHSTGWHSKETGGDTGHGITCCASCCAGYTAPGETINILCERGGKPILANAYGQRAVRFSMSRSANVAAYAFAHGCRVGVDIEEVREFPDMTGVINDHFTEREKAQFNAGHRNQRTRLFFQLWTRKEAVLKADGIGLLQPLNQVNVLSDAAAKGSAGQVKSGPLSRSDAYTVLDLEAPHGFAASLAYENTTAETLIRYRGVPVRHQAAGRAHRRQKTHANA